jgi:hypothetical protein
MNEFRNISFRGKYVCSLNKKKYAPKNKHKLPVRSSENFMEKYYGDWIWHKASVF